MNKLHNCIQLLEAKISIMYIDRYYHTISWALQLQLHVQSFAWLQMKLRNLIHCSFTLSQPIYKPYQATDTNSFVYHSCDNERSLPWLIINNHQPRNTQCWSLNLSKVGAYAICFSYTTTQIGVQSLAAEEVSAAIRQGVTVYIQAPLYI